MQLRVVDLHPCADFIAIGDGTQKGKPGFNGLFARAGDGDFVARFHLIVLVWIQCGRDPYPVDIGQCEQRGGRHDIVAFARIDLRHHAGLRRQYRDDLDHALVVFELLYGFDAYIFVQKLGSLARQFFQQVHHVFVFKDQRVARYGLQYLVAAADELQVVILLHDQFGGIDLVDHLALVYFLPDGMTVRFSYHAVEKAVDVVQRVLVCRHIAVSTDFTGYGGSLHARQTHAQFLDGRAIKMDAVVVGSVTFGFDQVHAANRTSSRMVLHDFRVHRADPDFSLSGGVDAGQGS